MTKFLTQLSCQISLTNFTLKRNDLMGLRGRARLLLGSIAPLLCNGLQLPLGLRNRLALRASNQREAPNLRSCLPSLAVSTGPKKGTILAGLWGSSR